MTRKGQQPFIRVLMWRLCYFEEMRINGYCPIVPKRPHRHCEELFCDEAIPQASAIRIPWGLLFRTEEALIAMTA